MKSARPYGLPTWLRGWSAILAVSSLMLALPALPRLCAGATPEKHRKIIRKVTPEYPDVARKIKLGGTVRLAVHVAANGRVMSTHILGGHPVLAKFATEAVEQWQFETSSQSTEEIVQITFQSE